VPRWTLSDLARIRGALDKSAPSKGKYRNESFVYNSRRYSSKLEARYAQHLDLLWKAGEILWYTTQVPFVLEGGVIYRADFLVVHNNPENGRGNISIVDATGVMTQVKANKLKQLHDRYGITAMIYRKDGRLVSFEGVAVTRRTAPRSIALPRPA